MPTRYHFRAESAEVLSIVCRNTIEIDSAGWRGWHLYGGHAPDPTGATCVVCSGVAIAHRPVPKILPQKLGAQVPDDPRPRRDVTSHEACIHL